MQVVGMVVFSILVVAFYVFLGPFLGNRIVENAVLSLFSFVVMLTSPIQNEHVNNMSASDWNNIMVLFFQAFSVVIFYVRCTWIDPSDRTNIKKKRAMKLKGLSKLNYKLILYQVVVRFFKRMEHKILKCCIRRKYLDPWNNTLQMEPLLPFPLIVNDDAVPPYMKEEDITFCSLCDFEVCILEQSSFLFFFPVEGHTLEQFVYSMQLKI